MDNKAPGHGHSHQPHQSAKHYLHSCLKSLHQKRFLKEKEGDRGFTFVELLVVIGIIGILSSVVLTSVSTARGKAIEAKTKQELSQAKAQADIYEIFHSNYGTADNTGVSASCDAANTLFTDPAFASVITQAEITSGGSAVCASTPSKWVLAVPLASTPGSFWCTDSTGISIVGEANTASDAVNCVATGGGGGGGSDNYGSDNYNADDDGDGLTNGDETTVYQTNPNLIDSDSDTLTDYNEIFVNNTDPNLSDTDGDGSGDGEEILYGTDPLDPNSFVMP